ncbi:MAG: rhodanese-like domain-containing protein [Thermoplasmata archaeon]
MVARTTPEEVARRLAKEPESLLLLDVREDEERATAVIEPSIHIPMNEVPERLAEISRDREVIVYCHHGARSEMVAGFLEDEGYSRVSNLSGGIDAWSAHVDRKVPRYM